MEASKHLTEVRATGTTRFLQIVGVIISVVLISIYVSYLIDRFPQNDIEKQVYTFENQYAPYWKLNYAQIDDQNDQNIIISFESNEGSREDKDAKIREIYDSAREIFLEDSDSKYREYSLTLLFTFVYPFGPNITDISRDQESAIFSTNGYYSTNNLARYFPDISRISVKYYEDIHDFDGFTNLKYIRIFKEISTEDREYLMSLFPDCEIEIEPDPLEMSIE